MTRRSACTPDNVRACRLSSAEVTLAAIWDLLTMQCDRHGQNVHVDASGHLTLIDLDQAFGDAWRVCGADSIFLPTTQKHAIQNLGYWYVMKFKEEPQSTVGLQHRLDYRCHVERGAIGTDYPAPVARCLRAIDTMSPDQVRLACTASLSWYRLRTIWKRTRAHN